MIICICIYPFVQTDHCSHCDRDANYLGRGGGGGGDSSSLFLVFPSMWRELAYCSTPGLYFLTHSAPGEVEWLIWLVNLGRRNWHVWLSSSLLFLGVGVSKGNRILCFCVSKVLSRKPHYMWGSACPYNPCGIINGDVYIILGFS